MSIISGRCKNAGHKLCKGFGNEFGHKGKRVKCICVCHFHICPRCHQTTPGNTRNALLRAANAVEAIAQTLRLHADVR